MTFDNPIVNSIRSVIRHLRSPEHLYGWWWWRSPNRPNLIDDRYIQIVKAIPAHSIGLDIGCGANRIRPDAITLDANPNSGADIICDATRLPFNDNHFDYVWCNAVLEHVPHPHLVAAEIQRTLKPGGMAIIQIPFLENVHGWPHDYYRFTIQGLRVLFDGLEEIESGVSAGPGQVLPDLLQYYSTLFAELQKGGLLINLWCIFIGIWLLPLRWLDHMIKGCPSYWKWARAYYYVGKKPIRTSGLIPQLSSPAA
jgi:SAM-dependent methyltransferase